MNYRCGPAHGAHPNVAWAKVQVEGNGHLLVDRPGGVGTLRMKPEEFDWFSDLPTVPKPLDRVDLWQAKRNMQALCHKGRAPVVWSGERDVFGPARFLLVEREQGLALAPFRRAETLHYHVLKHVLGMKESKLSDAEQTYQKLYAPMLRPFLPPDNAEASHKDWIDRLKDAACPSFRLWQSGVSMERIQKQHRPCYPESGQLCKCHGALADLSWAWCLVVAKWLPQALQNRHLHGSHEGEQSIAAWTGQLELRLAEQQNAAVVRTAFVPGSLNTRDRVAGKELSFTHLLHTGRYEEHQNHSENKQDSGSGGHHD